MMMDYKRFNGFFTVIRLSQGRKKQKPAINHANDESDRKWRRNYESAE
jgi:hypothetical protein